MGFFGRKRETGVPHPRRDPVFSVPLSREAVEGAFGDSVDFQSRAVALGGDRDREVTVWTVDGMVRAERVNDYVLLPLHTDRRLGEGSWEDAFAALLSGGVWTLTAEEVRTTDEAVFALLEGATVVWFPALGRALRCGTVTEEKRAVTAPEDEPAVKGGRDAFVESVRTNTSLVRRRLREPGLRVAEETVGRRSRTPVDIVYIEGIANAEVAAGVRLRLGEMDVDGVLEAGSLEQYLCPRLNTPFPQIFSTQRPDRFCAELLCGRVGVLVDGIPLGFVVPGDLGLFMATVQDRTDNWVRSACVTALRYGALLLTLLLPAVYTAAVLFHPEMIPLALAKSIIAAKENVPFGTLFEVMAMLLAFEIIQEAGLRLPGNLGQTVSILGGLVVGTAAVEAKIVSPAVLIVVALAGIAGYTIPSQDLAGGVRLWRLGLVPAAGLGGMLGVSLGAALLVGHLATLTSFGTAWLSPFAAEPGQQVEGHALFRVPLPRVKLRPAHLKSENRRNQR